MDRLADRVSLSPDRPSQSALVTWLTYLSVGLSLGVSAPLLTVLGIPYDAPTGNFVFKIHPGTYALGAAFALALAERGNPIAELWRSLAHQPAVAFYLLTDALVTGFSVARHGLSGAAFFVDAQLAPGVLALLLARLDLAALRRLFALIVAFFALNATLGVAEQLVQTRAIPLTVLGGQELGETVFRATALSGHPLAGASVTALALFAFWSLADFRVRVALCWLAIVALLSFGGRTSLGLSLALFAVLLAFTGLRALRRGTLSYRMVTGGAALAALLVGAVLVAVTFGGIGERILGNLAWDRSAEVRQVSVTVYQLMRPEQLLFGVSPDEIGGLIRRLGLDYPYETIENFWIVLSLQLGFPFFALFTAGFLVLLLHLARISGAPMRLALLGFVLAASTNNSLSAKTTVLSVVVATIYGCAAYQLGRERPVPAALHGRARAAVA